MIWYGGSRYMRAQSHETMNAAHLHEPGKARLDTLKLRGRDVVCTLLPVTAALHT